MVIITGVSRGIGKALAEQFLANGQKVIGVGRTNTIVHPNFVFYPIDFQKENVFDEIEFDANEELLLINNAGMLGEVKRISDQDNWDLERVLKVNTVAPMQLTRALYSKISNKKNFTLVNISSGAATKAIPSWAAYCASKAALNMLTENFYLEEREKGNFPKVYCVAPGVIDTAMQAQIRATNADNFSSHQRFVDLKENKQLFSPEECASRLINLLQKPFEGKIFHDLREN